MEPVLTPAYELFLVVEPVRIAFHDVVRSLTVLSERDAPEILAVDIYYRQTTDIALLAIRFNERALTGEKLAWVQDVARGAGLPVLDPVRLSDENRRAFYASYLAGYELRLDDFAGVQAALFALGRRLDLLVHGTAPTPPPPPRHGRLGSPPIGIAAAAPAAELPGILRPAASDVPRRPEATDPPGGPQVSAGGAMGKLAPGQRRPSERALLPLSRQARDTPSSATASRPPPTSPPAHPPATSPPPLVTERVATPRRSRTSDRASTVPYAAPTPAPSAGAYHLHRGTDEVELDDIDVVVAEPPLPPSRPPAGSGVTAHPLSATATPPPRESPRASATPSGARATPEPREDLTRRSPVSARGDGPTPGVIDVRFLRGGQWTPARLRSLSLKAAYLVTGAPPRLGDAVHIAFGFADVGALVRGTVHQVTTAEDARTTGASGFAVRFPAYVGTSHEQLAELLTRARAAGVTIKPPPPRRAARFPVHWPVRFGGHSDSFRAEALDVSLDGMFIATPRHLGEGDLAFRLALDLGDASISGRAQVVREIGSDEATPRGLRSGYGLRISEISEIDQRQWGEFLERVRRRTERRVIVGASPERIEELALGLTAAGYVVTAGSDPGVLVRLADLDPRPPDAAVVDGSLGATGLRASWLEQLFATRHVPCITTQGEPVERTRSAVDRLLQIAA